MKHPDNSSSLMFIPCCSPYLRQVCIDTNQHTCSINVILRLPLSFPVFCPPLIPQVLNYLMRFLFFFFKSIMFFKKDLIVLFLYFLQLISNTSFAVVNGILKLPNYSARGDKVIGNIIQRNMKITGIRRFTLKSLNGQNISVTLNNQLKVRF